ncbi:MAG: hypothetical protein HN357_07805 [Chloroflexi bacterium]|jgi:hypothetical protein|nr:hypothetical protein [Chloroflexota bacterium]MBT3669502.1 hypothetical protein [Chloroflexota bacterium]MBT4002439.1 hypothetical protein [Chloroflexota bacterium]MBT4304479.1 hypothetical protein [Chloroflexota bacterium]MBT4534180.1 hypothetical protein [Chloroflexota bacterium]
MENSSPNRNLLVVIGSIAGCSLIILCCIVTVLAGLGGFAWTSLQAPEGAEFSLDVPAEVKVGEQFEIVISIENTQLEPQNLIAISFALDYLSGVEILDSDPTFIYQDEFEILEVPIQIFTYKEMILQDEIIEIRIFAEAVEVGDYAGEIQICLNSATNCERISTRTVVTE